MNKFFLVLLITTPLALLAAYFHVSPLITFFLSALAIIPLSKYIGDATESLTAHTNAGLGGFLNATFGNAPELIVGLFALNAGLIEVVKASIIGSVLGNVLLVLGTAIFLGGIGKDHQKFNVIAAKAGGSMLLLAALALVVPAFFAIALPTSTPNALLVLSVIVAVVMIVSYIAQLVFTLRTHKHLYNAVPAGQSKKEEPELSIIKSLAVLAAATIAVSFVSDTLVASIEPVVAYFGWTQLFIGIIIIAIVGNAAEHVSAIQAALRNHLDLTLSITIGSATQIVMFVAPLLVLASFVLGHPMNLVFSLFELVAFIFAIFVTNAVIDDGQSNWFEGVQLLAAYGILGVAFFLYT